MGPDRPDRRAPRRGPIRPADHVVREGDTLFSLLDPAGAPESMAAFLRRNAERFRDRPVYLEKRDGRLQEVTWARFRQDVGSLARFFRSCGIGKGDRIAVLSRNRGEMLVTEFTAMTMGAILVPIFAGYSVEQTRALLAHADPAVLVLADEEQVEKAAVTAQTRLIVTFERVPRPRITQVLPGYGGVCAALSSILGAGGAMPVPDRLRRGEGALAEEEIAPGDPCLMMYTSGTGGELKGVLLTHDNILSQQRALSRVRSLGPEDRFLSYLPWHHSFGGIFEKYSALYNGAPLAIDDSLGKSFPVLLENWKLVKPTVYFSVPAIYQQLVDHVRLHPEEEDAIFHPGIRFVFTAAAPLPASISAYFAARRIPVMEGWGLTETSPCCTLTDPGEERSLPGMVGYPIPEVKVRLAEDGEILVQGPNVMLGYYRNPEATRRVLPGDGWFRTGDLGEFAGRGLRLVARKDRIFKLLNGERVVPTPLEMRLAAGSPYIRHVVVAGTAREHLAALIFPNLPLIEEEFGADRERADRVVKESFLRAIRELNDTHPVRYERIQAFAVVSRMLSVENGELTPSMKVRVANVLGNYGEYIEAAFQPTQDCDCRFLRKVMRLRPEPRFCFRGLGMTLDRCHECGLLIFPDAEELEEPERRNEQ